MTTFTCPFFSQKISLSKITCLALIFLLGTAPHAADVIDAKQEAVKQQSRLTLLAFECSAIAADDDLARKHFNIGLEAGREFIEFALNNKEVYLKSIKPHIPELWSGMWGPSPDFILGQVYARVEVEIFIQFKALGGAEKTGKEKMYLDKKCADME